ncbi:MAG: radical SAM family heme chaperone HemW [Rhodothermaceae bacterium]|nr:radical SAM family heme chaperone HemW [Rhodothermaceae bacterium]MXX59428.1 radical SAM family heme chaperone HemW [Rhodothermaceae bacterium]MYD20455.1 radical SAM family heme chaperone HemW [Rhodothermaceae bacterium]MYD56450.1 radical SAM family heme chaperone HemW [Rhodothermaceae bacterium]MYI42504.1 radical SAM family heme chaperone HemW [Rhodothermaceae bacterium]
MPANQQEASLYVHIPFCAQRCSYCDFYFVTSQRRQTEFIEALCLEIAQTARTFPNTLLSTIYFGGGTPSLLPPQSITHILAQICESFDTYQVDEITLEANPEDINAPALDELIHAGITRISLGIQSFRNADLRFMNRCHNSDQALLASKLIQTAELSSWSLDLIFGIPGASEKIWQDNLHRAIETQVPHISTYSLTIEPQTPLHKQVASGFVKPASDERAADQFQQAMDILTSVGYEHYEISNFALPGHRAKHNTRYWHHTNYLGVGPSAHSFWWQSNKALRWQNVRSLRKYLEAVTIAESPTVTQETLSMHDLARERIMLALRTSEGLDMDDLKTTYGLDLIAHKKDALQQMKAQGFLVQQGTRMFLTSQGLHVCDNLTEQLWPD